ncbi:MAG: lamin tail domain-containing protein [Bacteroidota bacterium]
MKHSLPILFLLFAFQQTFAQVAPCTDLFISTYIEGFGNNRSVEIYNPTPNPIDLGGYTIGRFRNGSTSFSKQAIPSAMIQPYDVHVITIDKRNPAGTGFETPVWDGFQEWDVVTDDVTGDTIWIGGDPANGAIFDVQYDDDGFPLVGDTYRDFLDLQGKTDVFINPVYEVSTSGMYFNGDDAVALLKGVNADPANDGSNILDVVGLIGDTRMQDGGELNGIGWVDAQGNWLTRDRTLVRNANIQGGTGPVVFILGDTLAYSDWTVFGKNDFSPLESHDCSCDPLVNTIEINEIPVNVYPNPSAIGQVVIEADENIENVRIFDFMGRLQFTKPEAGINQQVIIPTSGLDAGMYLFEIEFRDGQRSIRKVVLQ